MYKKSQPLKYIWLYLLVILAMWVITGSAYIPAALETTDYNSKRLLLSYLLVLVPIVFLGSTIEVTRNKLLIIGAIIFIVAGFISAFFSAHPVKSLTGYWLIISLFVATAMFYNFEIKKHNIYLISALVSISIFIYIYIIYISLYLELNKGSFRKEVIWFFHGYSNPRFLNQIQTWCLPLLIICDELISRARNISPPARLSLRVILFITASSYISLIFLNGGRGTLTAYIICIPFLWILFGKRFNAIAKKILLYWIFGALLYFFLYHLIPPVVTELKVPEGQLYIEFARVSDSGRFYLWQLAVDTISNYPIFGVGPLMYSTVSDASNHPHNSLLWLMSEWGLIASISFISLLLYLMYLYLKRIVKFCATGEENTRGVPEELVISYSLAVSLSTAILHSLVSGLYIIPGSQIVGILIIILALSAYKSLEKSVKNSSVGKSSMILPIPVKFLATLFLIALLIPAHKYYLDTIWNQEDGEIGYRQPGYWLDGDY